GSTRADGEVRFRLTAHRRETAMRPFRLALLASAAVFAAPAHAQTADPARLNDYVRVLASDEFEGRGVATPGEEKTVAWLVERFKALGLEPGGPDGAWTQTAQLSRTQQSGPATIVA